MEAKFLGIPVIYLGIACLVVAVVYIFVWPKGKADGVTGLRFFLLRWGHAFVWVLLSISCFIRAFNPGDAKAANFIAMAGLGVYIGFLATFTTLKKKLRSCIFMQFW